MLVKFTSVEASFASIFGFLSVVRRKSRDELRDREREIERERNWERERVNVRDRVEKVYLCALEIKEENVFVLERERKKVLFAD